MIYLPVFILLFFITNSYADYNIVYSINMEKTRLGEIIIENRGNNIKTTINLEITIFADFKQEITTILKINSYPLTEDTFTKFGEYQEIADVSFDSNFVDIRKIKNEKTNDINFNNAKPCHTISSLLNLFIKNKVSDLKTFQVFNIDNFYDLKIEPVKTNEFLVEDKNDQYAIDVQQIKQDNAVVPKKIIIQKYKMLGIDWGIFNLSLKKYTEL